MKSFWCKLFFTNVCSEALSIMISSLKKKINRPKKGKKKSVQNFRWGTRNETKIMSPILAFCPMGLQKLDSAEDMRCNSRYLQPCKIESECNCFPCICICLELRLHLIFVSSQWGRYLYIFSESTNNVLEISTLVVEYDAKRR